MTRSKTAVRTLAMVLSCWAALASAPAAAQVVEDDKLARAKSLFKQGEVQFDLGEYATALELYREAYTLQSLPGLLFNIGQCHYNLGHYEKALSFYQRYLLKLPEAPNRAAVEELVRKTKDAIEQRKRDASAADERDATPQTRPTPTTAPAPASARRDDVSGSSRRVDLAASDRPSGVSPAQRSGAAPREEPGAARKILLWSGIGLGAALITTGAITGGLALSHSDEFRQPTTPLPRQLELLDSGEPLAAVSTVTFAAGAAVLVGTAVYYWLGRRGKPADAAPGLAVSWERGGGIRAAVKGNF